MLVAYLHAIAEAIGLPSAGSADQLRQCIEGKLRTERDDPNVVVIVKVQTTDKIVPLADSKGEFAQTSPLSSRRGPGDEDVSLELQEAHAQLQEAEQVIESARKKDASQAQLIADLQEALRKKEQTITRKFEDKVAELTQKLLDEKAKL